MSKPTSTFNPSAKRFEASLGGEEGNLKADCTNPLLLLQKEIWVNEIFPFLGPGHFIFVAGVNRQMKELYLEYTSSLKVIPMMKEMPNVYSVRPFGVPAPPKCTFYTSVFSSVPCFEYWNDITDEDPHRLHDQSASEQAAMTGSLVVLQRMKELDFPIIHHETGQSAAKSGRLEVVQWLHSNGLQPDASMGAAAARSGHLEMLTWMHMKGCPLNDLTFVYAAYGGDFDVLKWLHEKECPLHGDVCDMVAFGGNLEALQWALDQGCEWDASTCAYAAESGHLNILQWAREKGCEWGASTCFAAAQNGYLDVLKWAHEAGCEWNKDICWGAASTKRLDILDYARTNGCPWESREICNAAVLSGCLDILNYVRLHGAEWHPASIDCHNAVRGGKEMLKYCLENGCLWNPDVFRCDIGNAIRNGRRTDVLIYILDSGLPRPDDPSITEMVASLGHLPLLKYLHRKGYTWDHRTWEKAQARCDIRMMKYLEDKGCPKEGGENLSQMENFD